MEDISHYLIFHHFSNLSSSPQVDDRKVSSVNAEWRLFSGEFEVFTESASVFTVRTTRMLCCFDDFFLLRDDRSGYWSWPLFSRNRNCVSSLRCVQLTGNRWFSSLVTLMCSRILVDRWWSLWLMCSLLHDRGILQTPNFLTVNCVSLADLKRDTILLNVLWIVWMFFSSTAGDAVSGAW